MAYREEYSRGAPALPAETPAKADPASPVVSEARLPTDPDSGDAAAAGEARSRKSPVPAEHPEAGKSLAPAAEAGQPAPVAKKPRRKLVLFVVLTAALAGGGYEGYEWFTNGRFMVSTDDAYVQADITTLSAKVSGYVDYVAVANNQSVKAGDLIAKIDDGDYRLAVQSAKDKLATQTSTIDRIGRQIEAARASVGQAAAQVDAAKADAERAAADFERQQQLAKSDFASRSRFDEAKADRDRTQAAVKSAQAALDAARANVEVLAAQQAEARKVAAELETAVEKAERDLAFTEIRAPADGVVGNKAVDTGSFVQPGTRLFALVPLEKVHIDANFKETQLAGLRPGQSVRVEVDALPDREITGTVESVSPAAGSVFSLLPPENATGNFTKIVQRVPVRIAVPAEVAREGVLRPGLSVVVSVDRRENPAKAVASASR
jgi:membrane fusion protein (multidrug efflux system)